MEETKKGKKKIIIISIISVVLILAIAGVTYYKVYTENQVKLNQEKEQTIAKMQERYNIVNSQIELLILSEDEQKEVNTDLTTVKNAIEEKNVTDNTNNVISKLEKQVEEIKNNNISILTEKENELKAINIEKFNEEQKAKVNELQNAYNNLKKEGKYKEAKAKIEELIQYNNTTNTEIIKQEEAEKEESKKQQSKPTTSYKPPQTTTTTPTEQPSTQTQPTTPSQPQEPTTPATPSEPEQPSTPSQPEQPSTEINKPSKVYTSSFSITHSDIEWTKDTSGNQTKYTYTISGTIQNNSGYDLSRVQVFGSFNENGRGHVGSTTIYNLGNGERYNFSISIRENMFFTFSNCSVTATGYVE